MSANVFCLKQGNTVSGMLEVHAVGSANGFQAFAQEAITALKSADAAQHFVFGLGDYNGDGILDLYCLKVAGADSGKLEVHVLNGADNYKTFLLDTATALAATDVPNFVFGIGDFNGDGHPDVYCLKKTNTESDKLEVHVLNGADNFQTFLLHTSTALTAVDGANFAYGIADYNGDGHPDVYCLKKTNTDSGKLEVHVLNGADNFQTFLLDTATAMDVADAANFAFAVADYDGNGVPDVIALKTANVESGHVEVHVLGAADNFQTYLTHSITPITLGDVGNFAFGGQGLLRSGFEFPAISGNFHFADPPPHHFPGRPTFPGRGGIVIRW